VAYSVGTSSAYDDALYKLTDLLFTYLLSKSQTIEGYS